ncbi:MAG: type II toxin-antitoxin system VapC family toxin [Chloroflexi bacterium]|nr:MAG: type II toxin-antitoxin system VapC family toxin [Chloroflexota bacterium]
MNVLLDTHVALWWLVDPDELSGEAQEAIADGGNRVLLSAASVWEAAIKAAAGRLGMPSSFDEAAFAVGMEELPVYARHTRRAAALPPLHRDPFDRILVGQALEEGLVIVTRDAQVRQYPVATLPA